MSTTGTLPPEVDTIRTRALLAGLGALGLSIVLGFFFPKDFSRAYQFSYIFFLGLSLGSLALLMVHRQLGGAWGFLLRRPLEASAMTLPLVLVLFLPIALQLGSIYKWTQPAYWEHAHHDAEEKIAEDHKAPGDVAVKDASHKSEAKHKTTPTPSAETGTKLAADSSPDTDPALNIAAKADDLMKFKRNWLNPGAFYTRLFIYFGLWIFFAYTLGLGSLRQDASGSVDLAYRLNALSAPGIVVFFLSVSFALIDFGMSLEPDWYSSLYGVILIIGQGISTVAFMILVATYLTKKGVTDPKLSTPETFNDMGNLLLAFTMLWGYLSFSQFLIIWAGDLTEEIPWYARRLHFGWVWVGRFLMVFHFFVPFLILLARPVKRNRWQLKLWMVACIVLGAHLVNDFWLIGASPAFDTLSEGMDEKAKIALGYFRLTLLDLIVPVAVGGIWLTGFLTMLKSRPLVIAYDPQLEPAYKQARGGH